MKWNKPGNRVIVSSMGCVIVQLTLIFFIFPFCWLFLGTSETTVSNGGGRGGSGSRALFVMLVVGIKDFKMPRRRRQRERQKGNRLNKQNINSARASRFFVHFFAVTARLRRENT